MSNLVIRGGHILTPLQERLTDLSVQDAVIDFLGPVTTVDGTKIVDASGCFVTPGLIDLQVNGNADCDFWGDPSQEQINKLAADFAKAGVLTILPTLITDSLQHLRQNIEFLKSAGVGPDQLSSSQPPASTPVRMPGIHLEGPCLSPGNPGVHPKEHLAPLSEHVLKQIVVPPVKLITLAPELDSSFSWMPILENNNVAVALGHSCASFEEAGASFDRGIAMMTHTYNALPPIHHRKPGAVTAALLDERVDCCLILDGKHVLPPAAKLVAKLKTAEKVILVTDIAHVGTLQGGLVGSSILLSDAVRNAVTDGIFTFQEAIRCATYNPARAMGWQQKVGMLTEGALADIVIWEKQRLSIKHVISGGRLLF